MLNAAEREAIDARVAAIEAATGAEVVTAVIGKADAYPELPWTAFAAGASLAALGAVVAAALLAEARAIGYRELKLDTLEWMTAARALYARLGFRECAPYYRNPLPGVVYMACTL